MPWPQTGAIQYHAQLGLPDKGRVIKGLVVCNSWDLEPLDLLNGLALGCYRKIEKMTPQLHEIKVVDEKQNIGMYKTSWKTGNIFLKTRVEIENIQESVLFGLLTEIHLDNFSVEVHCNNIIPVA